MVRESFINRFHSCPCNVAQVAIMIRPPSSLQFLSFFFFYPGRLSMDSLNNDNLYFLTIRETSVAKEEKKNRRIFICAMFRLTFCVLRVLYHRLVRHRCRVCVIPRWLPAHTTQAKNIRARVANQRFPGSTKVSLRYFQRPPVCGPTATSGSAPTYPLPVAMTIFRGYHAGALKKKRKRRNNNVVMRTHGSRFARGFNVSETFIVRCFINYARRINYTGEILHRIMNYECSIAKYSR